MTVIHSVSNSATPTAHQMPSIPNIAGNKRSMAIWNIRVRKNEIAADTTPLLKAVKKEEAKILKPLIK